MTSVCRHKPDRQTCPPYKEGAACPFVLLDQTKTNLSRKQWSGGVSKEVFEDTSLGLGLTAKFPGNRQKLQEVTVSGQEIVWHITPLKTATCHFKALFFQGIKQTRYSMLTSKLWKCRQVDLVEPGQLFPPVPSPYAKLSHSPGFRLNAWEWSIFLSKSRQESK